MERAMSRRRIGQEVFAFGGRERRGGATLDELGGLIDRAPIERELAAISCAAKGEPAWPPLALFKALLVAVWHDLSDVKLVEALDDRASFRRFCGFSALEPTPELTAFVRFHTFGSVAGDLGFSKLTIAALLGHAARGVT
jgi:IS5 family transposase